MIYQEQYETMPREELEQLQIERLQMTLNRVYRHVAFYKNSFDANRVDIGRIRSVSDLKELPFTTKEDLRNSYPYDMFAVPLKDIVRIHSSSGTTGRPIVVGYTKNDIQNWSIMTARILRSAGVTEHDFVQIAFEYSLFTGGLGFHYGAERIGASVIPSSTSGNIQKQLYIMRDYKTSALLSTPSFAVTIASNLKEMGIHPDALNLRVGIFGAEPWSEEIRARIQDELHLEAFDSYGLSEIVGPGVSGECAHRRGLHVNEDHFIVEVVDPETLRPLARGAEGELVFTTITKEGCPIIRYRTGDLGSLTDEPCECGRTFVRMSRVSRRIDDMIIVRGAKIVPQQIEEILLRAEGVRPNYQAIADTQDGEDVLEIKIEISDSIFNDELKKMLELKNKIVRIFEADLGITPRITLVEQDSLRSEGGGKVSRIVDKR